MGFLSGAIGLITLFIGVPILVLGMIEYIVRRWLSFTNDVSPKDGEYRILSKIWEVVEKVMLASPVLWGISSYYILLSTVFVGCALTVDKEAFDACVSMDYFGIPVFIIVGTAYIARNHKRLQRKYQEHIRKES